MAYNPKTLTVSQGGTGDTSVTAYAVLCGGTTSTGALQSIAGVGTAGQILTSNGAGALPTFQAAAGVTPLFNAFKSASSTNATGDGTSVIVVFNTANINTGSAYNTGTGVFTAPKTGLYTLIWSYRFDNLGAAHTNAYLQLASSVSAATTYNYFNPFAVSSGGIYAGQIASSLYLTSSATVSCSAVIANGAKTVTIFGSNGWQSFSGYFVG